jgi:hypothetical protein
MGPGGAFQNTLSIIYVRSGHYHLKVYIVWIRNFKKYDLKLVILKCT